MAINRTSFFAYVRNAPFGGRLSTAQVSGMEVILDEWEKRNLQDIRWLAYMLATTFHETGATMEPIMEKGSDKYLSKYDTGKLAKALGNTPQADGDGQLYAGRGFVQITGRANYRKFGIEDNPKKALELPTAVRILFDGMINGSFTGKGLKSYFNETNDDPVNARRIVNGTDKAQLIAGYHKNFLDALKKGVETFVPGRKVDYVAPDIKPADAKPDDVPAAQSGTAWTSVAVPAATGLAVPMVTGIDNMYALIFSLVLIVLAAFFGFMFFSGRLQINKGKAPGVVA